MKFFKSKVSIFKYFVLFLVLLFVLQFAPRPSEVCAQSGNYLMSLFIRQRLTMSPDATTSTQSSEIYFFDTGNYIYASADGKMAYVADGTSTDDHSFTGTVTFSDEITMASTVCGNNVFAGTATTDTVVIAGATANDRYFITGKGGSVDQQDVLQAEAMSGQLVVHRLAAGASGLAYNWLRIN